MNITGEKLSRALVYVAFCGLISLSAFLLYSKGCTKRAAIPSKELDVTCFDIKKLDNLDHIEPIAVIGSGPAGWSAALYGARSGGVRTRIHEGPTSGGLLTQTTKVENWPGRVEIDGPDIIHGLKEQATKWGVQVINDTIERVDLTQWPFKLYSSEGDEINALTVIIATGATPRYLGVKGEQEYWTQGVTTCAVCDAPFYKDLDVVVVGGGDSAAEEAMQLAPYAKNITILVRADKMRASKVMQDHLKDYKQISIKYNVEVKEIIGDGSQVTAVQLFNNKDKSTVEFATSGVFLAIGHIPNTAFLKDSIKLTRDGHVHMANRTQETSVFGVFAAGDVEDDYYRQAGVAAGHGISAGLDATFFLNKIGYNSLVESRLREEGRLMEKTQEQSRLVLVEPIKEINVLDQFEVAIDTKKPIIVDFYSEDCPSCMQMLPFMEAAHQEFADQVMFVKVDASQALEIKQKYAIQKLPTILLLKDKQVLLRIVKALSKAELFEVVKDLIK